MSQNFAPYQDVAPDVERSFSPPAKSPSPRPKAQRNIDNSALSPPRSPPVPSYQNNADYFNPGNGWPSAEAEQEAENGRTGGSGGGNFWSSRSGIDLYQTSLGLRLDWEACLAYLGLPPAGPVVLLLFEHRSDYVRFHAWQSALLFSVLFILHIIFSWSRILSWIIFAGDLFLIGLLTFRAYKDAETVDRYELPIFGRLASSILDDE